MVTLTGFRFSWGGNRFPSFEETSSLLGADKAYSASKVLSVWNHDTNIEPKVLYPLREIKRRKRENERKKDRMDWRLVYGVGLSLRNMYKIRGIDQRYQPIFYDGNTVWQQPEDAHWLDEIFISGFYLVNFKLRFKNYQSATQDLMVHELGAKYSALPPQILTEMLFSIFMLTGERLLEKEVHSSPVLDSLKYYVKVGYFDSNGISISGHDFQRRDNGVVTHIRPHMPDPTEPPPAP